MNKALSTTKISAFLTNIEDFGVSRETVLKAAGIDLFLLSSPDNKLTSAEVNQIFQQSVRLTQNENIGLIQGERLAKGFSNILGYLLMNCGNLGEAAVKFVQYERIVDETSISEFLVQQNDALLKISTIDPFLESNRQLNDFKVAGMLSYTKILTGKPIILKEVHFHHEPPMNIKEYERIFNCPICFNQSANALIFDKKWLNLPVIEPNRELLAAFEQIARHSLAELEETETYQKKVFKTIVNQMKGEIPTIETVAKQLATSVRSLQNHLQKEGVSYTQLINKARKDIAIAYLKERTVSISEIAYLLGFSETSAFNRAFKKWTNTTPKEYRLKHSM